jgi:hypothetical protein
MVTGPWLREHAETARWFARTINQTIVWMHQQSPGSVLEKIPARYLGDRGIDLAAILTFLPMYSKTGTMTAEGAAAVKRVLSVSVETMKPGTST